MARVRSRNLTKRIKAEQAATRKGKEEEKIKKTSAGTFVVGKRPYQAKKKPSKVISETKADVPAVPGVKSRGQTIRERASGPDYPARAMHEGKELRAIAGRAGTRKPSNASDLAFLKDVRARRRAEKAAAAKGEKQKAKPSSTPKSDAAAVEKRKLRAIAGRAATRKPSDSADLAYVKDVRTKRRKKRTAQKAFLKDVSATRAAQIKKAKKKAASRTRLTAAKLNAPMKRGKVMSTGMRGPSGYFQTTETSTVKAKAKKEATKAKPRMTDERKALIRSAKRRRRSR